jgi:hypothetical protein
VKKKSIYKKVSDKSKKMEERSDDMIERCCFFVLVFVLVFDYLIIGVYE